MFFNCTFLLFVLYLVIVVECRSVTLILLNHHVTELQPYGTTTPITQIHGEIKHINNILRILIITYMI